MKRLLLLGAALAASIALAACGSSGGSSTSSRASTTSGAKTATVAVKSIGGVGNVLVDSAGKALYTADVESGGKIMCTGSCTSFWKPLTVGSGKPTAAGDVGKVGVIMRPDGSKQVTVNGKPVYSFSQDQPGKVDGNGFADQFAGTHFKWSAVMAGGSTSSSSGAGTTSTQSRNNYGY